MSLLQYFKKTTEPLKVTVKSTGERKISKKRPVGRPRKTDLGQGSQVRPSLACHTKDKEASQVRPADSTKDKEQGSGSKRKSVEDPEQGKNAQA